MDQGTLDTYTLIPTTPTEEWLGLEKRGMWIYRQSLTGVVYRIFQKTKEYMIVPPNDHSLMIAKIVAETFMAPGGTLVENKT